jgi:hypothetical protein
VQLADSTLLRNSLSDGWRDYLKLMSLELNAELQPLLLIKFDEDIAFRTKLKAIIRREAGFDREDAEHYLYYYSPGMKPPETTFELLEAHCNSFLTEGDITVWEKIPFVYSRTTDKTIVLPFEELDAGIQSPESLDFRGSILAILNFVNADAGFLNEPLAKVYGDFFQNSAQVEQHLSLCLEELGQTDSLSAFVSWQAFRESKVLPSHQAFAFIFVNTLLREFNLAMVVSFSRELWSVEGESEFDQACLTIFGHTAAELEMRAIPQDSSMSK